MKTKRRKAQAQFFRNGADLSEVPLELDLRFVQTDQRRAGELKLAGRLQRDSAPVIELDADRISPIKDRLSAEAQQPFQQSADAATTPPVRPGSLRFVGGHAQVAVMEAELLVLGSNAPFALRLAAHGNEIGQLAH